MRIPLARDGLGVMVAATVMLAGLGWAAAWVTPWLSLVPTVLWLWVLSFFRDPDRDIERDPAVFYAPADGTVTEVLEIASDEQGREGFIRVRIFLSLFNCHINRMPCAASITSVQLEPGKFLNAMKPQSAEENESNTLILEPAEPLRGPIVLRQIAGMIARTIVCHVRPGDQLRLEVKKTHRRGPVWKMTGRALVDGEVAAQADFLASTADRD